MPEDSHDGPVPIHAANLTLIGVDDAGRMPVRKKCDFVAFAQRYRCRADDCGREDGSANDVTPSASGDERQE